MNSRNIKESNVTGSESFSDEFLKPSSDNIIISSEMLDLMVEYYNATYTMFDFRKPFDKDSEDGITIQVKINQFRRCQIGSEIFRSLMSLRHVKICTFWPNLLQMIIQSIIILAKSNIILHIKSICHPER